MGASSYRKEITHFAASSFFQDVVPDSEDFCREGKQIGSQKLFPFDKRRKIMGVYLCTLSFSYSVFCFGTVLLLSTAVHGTHVASHMPFKICQRANTPKTFVS